MDKRGNKAQVHFEAGPVQKLGQLSIEGNRSLSFYSDNYGTYGVTLTCKYSCIPCMHCKKYLVNNPTNDNELAYADHGKSIQWENEGVEVGILCFTVDWREVSNQVASVFREKGGQYTNG